MILFDDYCTVHRDTSKRDEWDNIQTEEVYSGSCRYQQGVQAYMGISQRNSVLFLEGDVLMSENDMLTIVLSNGVERVGTVKTVRNIAMPITRRRLTRIEIIHDTERGE